MENSLDSDRTVNNSNYFSQEEISEKYNNLKNKYTNICQLYDASQQELHDLKRNNQFSSELKDHLTSEIEALQKNESKLKVEFNIKSKNLKDTIESLEREKCREVENFTNIIESQRNQISQLKLNQVTVIEEKTTTNLDNTKILEDLRMYEEEIMSLKIANAEMRKELSDSLSLHQLHQEEVEGLKEQVECLKSNLNSKKDEVSSLTEMLHTAQEDFCNANSELQQFKTSANTIAPKGNSLFAEVDDKRQEMLESLSQMKNKVYQLNRELISKQAEVDSLLCEKKTLWEEYAGQSNHHDAVLTRAYERRITDLEKQNDQLQRDIARWFDKNIDAASSEAAHWLSGVLDHYRKENNKLSCELTAASVNILNAEQKLRELQRQIVTWRTKTLEAGATLSALQTKLQLAERSILVANSTSIEAELSTASKTSLLPNFTEKASPPSAVALKDETNVSVREGFREINISGINKVDERRSESGRFKENMAPPVSGILVTGSTENKVPKKTSFK